MGEKIKKLKKIRIHREGNDTLIWSFIVIAAVALLLWRLDVKVWFWLFLIVFGTAYAIVVNFFRSIPFIILMVAMLPVANWIVGTSLGNKAMIVMLIIAASPYIARMVESSVKEVDSGVIEAAQSMGASNFEIVCKVLLPEAKPSLIMGAVISMVTILGYSAMSSTIGGTGLGQIAISYGHQRFNPDIKWICVFLTVIIVQIIQELGTAIAHRSDKRIKD